MIPLKDENPARTAPVVVIALIAVNVLIYLIDRLGAHGPVGALYEFRMVPLNIVYEFRGLNPPVPTLHPAWLTIFTSMFMHANLLHIGGNMLYLWIFGNNIEDSLGHFKFLLFYLAGGLAAAAAHIIGTSGNPLMASVPTVGASGAIAAVLGAYLVLFPSARVICLIFLGCFATTTAVSARFVLLFWIAIQLVSVSVIGGPGAHSGVAYWAHIGGFFAGIILIYLMGGKRAAGGRSPYDRNLPQW